MYQVLVFIVKFKSLIYHCVHACLLVSLLFMCSFLVYCEMLAGFAVLLFCVEENVTAYGRTDVAHPFQAKGIWDIRFGFGCFFLVY